MPGRPAPAPRPPVDPGPFDLSPDVLTFDGNLSLPRAGWFMGGLSAKTVDRLIKNGAFPELTVGGKRVVPLAGLRRYLAKLARSQLQGGSS